MELTHPLIIYYGIGILALAFLVTFITTSKYKKGKKSANSSLVKKLPYYRVMVVKYWIYKIVAIVSLMVAIVSALYLATKPIEVRTVTTETHNRDIMICFDVSTSLDGVNVELCESLKSFVKKLKGERFGINIFNGRSVTIVPLTTDYAFVLDRIQLLEDSILAYNENHYYFEMDEIEGFRFQGTLNNHDEYGGGSSFIGEGLATTLLSFSDLEEDPDRSRLIVFVTDNELYDPQGVSIISLPDACLLCREYGVKVFGLAPDFVVDEDVFEASIEATGGVYFNTRDESAMKDLIEKVRQTDVNTYYYSNKSENDVPERGMTILFISLGVYFICARRIRL